MSGRYLGAMTFGFTAHKPAPTPALPIDAALPELMRAMATSSRTLLCAPPGAGKTTRVPLALLGAEWCAARSILVLVPRRLAARNAAAFMAGLLGEPVGHTVGYQIRMDRRIGPHTRIEVLTEGVLTRRLQRDPDLKGVACVIFDEFHERHLQADLALALCLDLQSVLHPDLRLLVMSATLDVDPLRALLANPRVVTTDVVQHPVETRYLPQAPNVDLTRGVCRVIRQALGEYEGSLLAFLPGAREIRSAARRLKQHPLPDEVDLHPLYGKLSQREQSAALAPAPAPRRKVVLATNIAETSLTIDGVQVVVDSGYCRSPRLDAKSGMSRLITRRISRVSARQRRGRAGRNGPGTCLRLWDRGVHAGLVTSDLPEILAADLAPLALELAAWGCGDSAQLRWLDPPPSAALSQARRLLHHLEALDAEGRITAHGRRLVGLPLHPRLAHMVVKAAALDLGQVACRIAALLDERDPLRFEAGNYSADLQMRLALLLDTPAAPAAADLRARANTLTRIRRIAADLERQLGLPGAAIAPPSGATVGRLLAWAYPERLALRRRRRPGHFLLANGRAARVDPEDPLAAEEMLVAAHLDGQRRQARVFLAAAYDRALLETQFADQLETRRTVRWDVDRQRVMATVTQHLGALLLTDRVWPSPPQERVTAALTDGLRQSGVEALPWNRDLTQWVQRAQFVAKRWADSDPWPQFDPDTLMAELHLWLEPFLQGCRALREVTADRLRRALVARLSWSQQRALDRMAPSHVTVPSGSRLPIDYGSDPPILRVRIQEMFGADETPTIADGRQPLRLHLLSPAQRPMQITQDLAQFWRTGYPQVKKELHGRYPRHHWPEDPGAAAPTARAKARKAKS